MPCALSRSSPVQRDTTARQNAPTAPVSASMAMLEVEALLGDGAGALAAAEGLSTVNTGASDVLHLDLSDNKSVGILQPLSIADGGKRKFNWQVQAVRNVACMPYQRLTVLSQIRTGWQCQGQHC